MKVDINATKTLQSGPFSVLIWFNADVRIVLADPQTNLFYKINTDSMTGDPIASKQGYRLSYLVEFEEIHWLKESGECTNYGEGAEFKTIADCVANKQENVFSPILGCKVPWLAAPEDPNICKGTVELDSKTKNSIRSEIQSVFTNLEQMMVEDQFRTCLKPCQELKVHSKLRGQLKFVQERGRRNIKRYAIVLSFKKKVKVTRYFNGYGLFDLVVEAGSSLGLWIGLSALGVFDLVVELVDVVLKKARDFKGHPCYRN